MPDAGTALPPRQAGYARIEDYALIGDTRTAALIAKDGSLDWLCLPNFDGDSHFAAILDHKRGGHFRVGPVGEARMRRRYLGNSAILETTFTTDRGVLRLTDFMPIADQTTAAPRVRPDRGLLRLIEAVEGRPEVAVTYAPRLRYGDRIPKLRQRGGGHWVFSNSAAFLLLQSEVPLELTAEGTLEGRLTLPAGEKRALSLSYSHRGVGVLPPLGPDCWDECDSTRAWWEDYWACSSYDGPFADAVARSMITLRLLNFSQSGAVLAAPSMGLPEAIGGTRNWDYRYCWLRDASFILRAFLTLGYPQEGRAFFRWLIHTTQLSKPRLGVLYDLFGRHGPGERRADSLEGYKGSGPVYIGNGAHSQLQLDVYGEVLTAARLYVEAGEELGLFEQRRLRHFADVVCQSWTLPDNAIWEFRRARKHYTHSKAMCWTALDAAVHLSEAGALRADPEP